MNRLTNICVIYSQRSLRNSCATIQINIFIASRSTNDYLAPSRWNCQRNATERVRSGSVPTLMGAQDAASSSAKTYAVMVGTYDFRCYDLAQTIICEKV